MDDEEEFYPEPETYDLPVAALLTVGDKHGHLNWPDYARLYHITLDDAPELLRMAQDEGLHWLDSNLPEVWAPLHAWRTLGQLKALDTIPGLLAIMGRVDEEEGEWAHDEIPKVMALMGAAAIPHLQTFLADDTQGLYARAAAAR